MAETEKDIERDALRLPVEARARLAERLLDSLEGESEADIEPIWQREAERRLDEIERGEVVGVPADQVFAKARARFR